MAYYRVCPECGCTLDPGEPCDCRRQRIEAAPAATGTTSEDASIRDQFIKQVLESQANGGNR